MKKGEGLSMDEDARLVCLNADGSIGHKNVARIIFSGTSTSSILEHDKLDAETTVGKNELILRPDTNKIAFSITKRPSA